MRLACPTRIFVQGPCATTVSNNIGLSGDSVVSRPLSGDSFIPLVWGLFNLCRSLPKTYKPPLKTDKTPLETDKPPPKTNKPQLETDKPPPKQPNSPLHSQRQLQGGAGPSTIMPARCFSAVPHIPTQIAPFRPLPTEFPLNSQQTPSKFPPNSHQKPQKNTKLPPNSHLSPRFSQHTVARDSRRNYVGLMRLEAPSLLK